MGPSVLIYAFSEERDQTTLDAFVKNFVAANELGDERVIKSVLLDTTSSWTAPSQDCWLSFKNIAEAFDYGLNHPTAAFSIYLDAKLGLKATHTTITFTTDRHIVFGLSMPLPDVKLSEDERIPTLAKKLMTTTEAQVYVVGVEIPPPTNRAEFAALGVRF